MTSIRPPSIGVTQICGIPWLAMPQICGANESAKGAQVAFLPRPKRDSPAQHPSATPGDSCRVAAADQIRRRIGQVLVADMRQQRADDSWQLVIVVKPRHPASGDLLQGPVAVCAVPVRPASVSTTILVRLTLLSLHGRDGPHQQVLLARDRGTDDAGCAHPTPAPIVGRRLGHSSAPFFRTWSSFATSSAWTRAPRPVLAFRNLPM